MIGGKGKRRGGDTESSSARGYDSAWRKVRDRKAKQSPLCERCLKVGRYIPIKERVDGKPGVVHHIKPVDKFPELRLSMENLESLCWMCHEVEHGRVSLSGCSVDGMPKDPRHAWNKR